MLIVADARSVYYNMGGRATDPGIWMSEAGACIPETLPLGRCCKMGIKLKHETVQQVLHAADQGQTDIDPDLPVGHIIYDSKCNSGNCVIGGKRGRPVGIMLDITDRYAWKPVLRQYLGCKIRVPLGWIRSPSCKVKYMDHEKK